MFRNEVVIIATVSASLKMFDQMTQPLQQITQALNLTINAMDSMSNSANRDIRLTNSLNAAKGAIQRANSGLQELANSQDNASNRQEQLNNSFNRGTSSADGLVGKVKGLVKAYLGIQAAKEGIDLTVGGAMRAQQQLFTLQGIMGNKDVGTAYFNNLQKKANESVFAFEDFAGNARKYMQFTKNTDSLDKLANLSERLTLMDPTQGLQGAGFALKEMMSGDGVSLKERFGFGKADIEILKASKSMDEFISKFDTLLNKKGFTESMLEQYNQSAAAQFDNLKSNFKTAMAQSGNGALEALMPIITTLNQAFNTGTFQPFFDGLSMGLRIIADICVGFANVIQWIGMLIQNNWSIIEPILIAIGIYFTAMIIPALWDTITTLAAMAVAWLMVNWPVLLVVGAIALVIFVLAKCGITAQQVVGFMGGVFAVFFAYLYNRVVYIWNIFASLAEFFANVFNHPLYSIQSLFANIWNNIVDFVGGALEAIVGMIKEIPFLGDLIGDFSADSIKVEMGEAPDDYWVAPKMDMKDYGNEFDYGYNQGAGLVDGITDWFDGLMPDTNANNPNPDLGAWNSQQGLGDLGVGGDKDKDKNKNLKGANDHLKNIDDKIDISNEHLEMMRDLAEQESIQNFVTLTPTVQVTTGDIKEEADIDTIISKIESYMETELTNSAEGAYT